MNTSHVLIVNKNGLLSACPSNEDFALGNYYTDPERFYMTRVRIEPRVYNDLYANQDHAYILHPMLPERTDQEGRVYYQLNEKNWLVKAQPLNP